VNEVKCFKCHASVPESAASILDIGFSLRDFLSGEQEDVCRSSVILCPLCAKNVGSSPYKLKRYVEIAIREVPAK